MGSTVSSCGGKDRLALWASPEVVVAYGKQRIRPSRLCASPPFPSQGHCPLSLCTGQVEGATSKAVSIGRFRGARIRLNARSSPVPCSIQTPGMEVDHTGGQVKPLTGRISCVVEEGCPSPCGVVVSPKIPLPRNAGEGRRAPFRGRVGRQPRRVYRRFLLSVRSMLVCCGCHRQYRTP